MHESLLAERSTALNQGLPAPVSPIIDIHMHSHGPTETAAYVDSARRYGVVHACSMEFHGRPSPMKREFGDFFIACGWPRLETILDWDEFRRYWIDGFDALLGAGMRSLKFRSVPDKTTSASPPVLLTDERIRPLLALAEAHRILVQIHVADPSPWWGERYDPTIAGPKSFYLEQVEALLDRHPRLPYLGVHMGGNPEDLTYLEKMIKRYPNYHLDTSATKWVIREMSAKPGAARDFFLRHADRICFGSDLVVAVTDDPSYYDSRFHVQRSQWESDRRGHSMIADPDAPKEGPFLNGLALPTSVLHKLYYDNAARLLGLPT
ncbi:MAG: amidohydrolase family protein [Planctomycetota bacterium]|jgi:predicted TIM-barrel fold metal-dependent hydrolase